MGRFKTESLINYSENLETAKQAVVKLMEGTGELRTQDLLLETNLEKIESGIRTLNEIGSKSWLVSSILLYSLIYDQKMYEQSGLDWINYMRESRKRLNLDPRDISEQLSSARYFIRYHDELIERGWSPIGTSKKLARAELAENLTGDHQAVLEHLISDSFRNFKDWYTGYKLKPIVDTRQTEVLRDRIELNHARAEYKIDGKSAVTLSDDLPEEYRAKLNGYLTKIFESLKSGYEPAIIPVKTNEDAQKLMQSSERSK